MTCSSTTPASRHTGRPQNKTLDNYSIRGCGACYVSANTHWLYKAGVPSYELGYWRDAPVVPAVGTRVCLYAVSAKMWRCAWNEWGPLSPRAESR